jgi:putative aldouronate transport system substrate-binding protein
MDMRKNVGVKAVVAVSVVGLLMTACSAEKQTSEQPTSAQQTEKAKDATPTTIEIMSTLQGVAPKETSDVQKELEKLTNTKLNITWVPETAYKEKLNATMASGTLPQVMFTNETKSANIINAARSGAFWEVGPYLKDYPNLSKQMDPEVLKGIAIDGKFYMLPRHRDAARHVITIRKDWLDKLGLAMPKTLDDLYKVSKAFTENDPDGNGKKDTVGLVEDALNAMVRSIAVYHGAPMNYGVQNGQVVPNFMTAEYLEGLKFYKKLFAEKLMNSDFPIINTQQRRDMMAQGKAGIMIAVESDAPVIQKEAVKLNPKAEFDLIQGVTGPKGLIVSATSGYNGAMVFSKSSIKTEADLKKILTFYDKMSTPEMLTLTGKGIKDIDYKIVDGFVEPANPRAEDRKADANYLNFGVANPSNELPIKSTDPLVIKGKKMVADNAKIAIYDVTTPLDSKTKTEKGPELDKISRDAQIKFIMGEIDEAGYKKALEQWSKAGGDQIIKEFTEDYKKQGGK